MTSFSTSATTQSFTLAINIYASTESIIEAWINAEMLEMWLFDSVVLYDEQEQTASHYTTAQEGYTLSGTWKDNDTTVVTEKAILTQLDNNKALWIFSLDYGTLQAKVKEVAGDNILQLQITVNENHITKLEALRLRWTFYLCNLKSVLEGGLDLRNKNPALKRLIND